jgi:hypothetical protein
MKRFEYTFAKVNELAVEAKPDAKLGQRKVAAVRVHDEPLKPTERFWTSLFARYGFNGSIFKFFRHEEVFSRVSLVENDRLRICIEHDDESGEKRLLAVSSPTKPIVLHDDLMGTLDRYQGQGISYADGIVESTHTPRIGSNTFSVCGDNFSNRFVISVPIDGYGQPNIYLSLLRHICSNGAIGYAKAFRSSLALGKGNDDVVFSIVRALDGFACDDGFAALRQRFEAAGQSWASVYEAQNLYKHLAKLQYHKRIGWDGAVVFGDDRTQQQDNSTSSFGGAASSEQPNSPMLTAFHRMTGDISHLYGLANPDALSVKRQKTLPVACKVYDLLNFVSEVATHHADEYGSRSSQAWLGLLISGEYDLENSCESYGDFKDFFIDRKLDGETAMDLQRHTG